MALGPVSPTWKCVGGSSVTRHDLEGVSRVGHEGAVAILDRRCYEDGLKVTERAEKSAADSAS